MLFLYAAISKLLTFENFILDLGKSPFIGSFSHLLAWMLPAIEILVALLLALPGLRLLGLFASLFLMSLFTAYLVAMLNFSYYIPCSCGGVLSLLSWKQHIIFNCFFFVLSITGILLHYKQIAYKNALNILSAGMEKPKTT